MPKKSKWAAFQHPLPPRIFAQLSSPELTQRSPSVHRCGKAPKGRMKGTARKGTRCPTEGQRVGVCSRRVDFRCSLAAAAQPLPNPAEAKWRIPPGSQSDGSSKTPQATPTRRSMSELCDVSELVAGALCCRTLMYRTQR